VAIVWNCTAVLTIKVSKMTCCHCTGRH